MRRTILLAVLAVLVLGCGTAPSEPLREQTPLPLELRRIPRPAEVMHMAPTGAPGDSAVCYAWGGAVEFVGDVFWLCQVYEADTETFRRIYAIHRSAFIRGTYLDNGEGIEWPE